MAEPTPTIPVTRDTAILIMRAIDVAYSEGQLPPGDDELVRLLYAVHPDVVRQYPHIDSVAKAIAG